MDRPLVFRVSTPRAQAPSASAVTDPDLARAWARSSCPPWPRGRSRWARREPKVGLNGQNIQRPKITSRAGSSVIIASRVTPTPMAATGPRPAVEFISASVRQSIPTITVPALAMMAGVARCSANAIASCRSS